VLCITTMDKHKRQLANNKTEGGPPRVRIVVGQLVPTRNQSLAHTRSTTTHRCALQALEGPLHARLPQAKLRREGGQGTRLGNSVRQTFQHSER
jgi:hypothetical protein